MFKSVLISVVALTGSTVSAPAQVRVKVQLGRIATVSADLARRQAPSPRLHVPRARSPRLVSRRWEQAPLRYDTVRRQVWVPGYYEVVTVPARYGWTVDWCGVRVWGVVAPACTRNIWRPGHWAYRTERIPVRRY